MVKKAKNVGIWIGAFALVAILVLISWKTFGTPQSTLNSPVVTGDGNVVGQCAQNPAYTYSATDAFGTTVIGGTDQIKIGSAKPVSSLANPVAGKDLQYWKSNSTYFCNVASDKVNCGSQLEETKCYQNATVTLAVRDLDNDVSLTNGGGAQNLTVGANQVHNLELRFQGTSKQANMPFGGCVAVEYPATMLPVTVNGAGISNLKACPYKWTYSVSATTNTYELFEVPTGFDADGLGDLKRTSFQVKSGSTNPSGTAYVTFQPANYYVTNDGQIVLGIEKDKNQDTTKTFGGTGNQFSFVIV